MNESTNETLKNGVGVRVDCPCHNFTALSKIVDVLNDANRTKSMIDWLNGDTDKIAMQQQKLLSCGKRFQCRFRYGTSFAILNAIRDACKPFLEPPTTITTPFVTTSRTATNTVHSIVNNPSPELKVDDERSFPPLQLKSQEQKLQNHPGLSNFLPTATIRSSDAADIRRTQNGATGVINTLHTRKKKSKRRDKPPLEKLDSSDSGVLPRDGLIVSQNSSSSSVPHQTVNEWTSRVNHHRNAISKKQPPEVEVGTLSIPTTGVVSGGVGLHPSTGTASVSAPTLETINDIVSTTISDQVSCTENSQVPISVPTPISQIVLHRPTDHSTICSEQMNRLVDIYVALMRNMLVPSTPLELHFLFKLIFLEDASQSGSRVDGTTTLDKFARSSIPGSTIFFKRILEGQHQCKQFAQKALNILQDSLLHRLSPFILTALVRSEPFQKSCPNLVLNLNRVLTRIKTNRQHLLGGTSDEFNEKLSGTHAILTLPFDRDRDSRHNYKTPAEIAVYNNREESRDAFLSQLRTFMTAKSKGFLNQDVDRAREVAEKESIRIIRNVSSFNMIWFSQFFLELLLQVGRSPVEEMDPDLLKIADDRERLQQLHKRFSKKIPTLNSRIGNKNLTFTGNRMTNKHIGHIASPSPFQEALPYFTGYQEFFFIFMYSIDSYNFSVQMLNQIATMTKRLISDLSSNGVEKRALDLQMIARFLGVLVFSPNWRTEAVDWSKIKPVPPVDTGLQTLDSIGLCLVKMVQEASDGGFLFFVIPWMTELLKMSQWDTTSQSSKLFRQLLANLRLVQRVLTSREDTMYCSPGMQMVSFHLESFFNETISLPKLTSLPTATLKPFKESVKVLDQLDLRLSLASLFACSPYMEDLLNLIEGGARAVQNSKTGAKGKKLRPSIISVSLTSEISSFELESPRSKLSSPSNPLGKDSNPSEKMRVIQQKLVDEFFHMHLDLKIICDFAIDQALKSQSLSGHTLSKFAIQASLERPITPHSTELDMEDFQMRAMELSLDHVRDHLNGMVDQSLRLFGPSGLSQKVLDMAIKLSVTHALSSSQLWMRNVISSESTTLLEGRGTGNGLNSHVPVQSSQSDAKPSGRLIVDTIRAIEVVQNDMSTSDPEHNLRIIADASNFVELVIKSAAVASDEPTIRNLFEAIWALDRVSEAILSSAIQSDNHSPWNVFVRFLYFATNLTKISSYGMKHLSKILGEDNFSQAFCELRLGSQAAIGDLAGKLASQYNLQQPIDELVDPRTEL
jgi:hypothetical protein